MKIIESVVVALIVLALASCATRTQEEQKIAPQYLEVVPAVWVANADEGHTELSHWLEQFNDPKMLQLIAEGKANNRELQVAAGNMNKAWLLAKQSAAALQPSADLSLSRAQTSSGNSGTTEKSFTVSVQSSWELDVWGRIRSATSAAKSRAQTAQADYVFARQSLSANIAKTYIKIIEAILQANISQKNAIILKKNLRITQAKYDNGLASAQDLALTRANLAAANEQIITIEGSQRDAIRALELLLGRYPNAALDIANKLPSLPPSPPAGVPSYVLERRPDMVAAERKIASAFNATAQAKAARLPRFSLTSTLSGASGSLSDVLSPTNVAWQLAANLMAPLIDGGRRKIDIEIATVEQQQAVSNYIQKALTSFAEVENNLDQGQVLAQREVALREVQKQSDKAFRIAQLRYNEGESDLLDTLQIQQQAIAAQSSVLSIQRLQLEQRINLYLALGCGW